MAGHGPLITVPNFATDEHVAIQARGDYITLSPKWQTLAEGNDGSFAADAPWVLNSDSVNFQSQGVAAQSVVVLSAPPGNFPGGGHLFAVDSVSGNSATLRRVGLGLNVGQPPAPAAGLTSVKFSIPTQQPQLDQATYRVKQRWAIDEMIFYRSSSWMYQGTEDAYRVLRDVVVFGVLLDAYEFENRAGDGDFERKMRRVRERLGEAEAQATVRWGPFGNSEAPTNIFSQKISR